ncbi:TPA: UDP-N-acetylmuramate--L-alanine ligase, partial [bacterium]|nr:UDP-N-acetylmuramate--L-alanine ligase [bacterium]
GAHGKTTSTGLIGCVLEKMGLDPTIINGGIVLSFGSNTRLGNGRHIVCELDESDGSFSFVHSKIAVVTNIDREHMDYFKTMKRMLNEYLVFINQAEMAILCGDDKYIRKILPSIKVKYTTYGTRHGILRARNIVQNKNCTYFDVLKNGNSIGRWKINLIGRHNVLNALSAISVGEALSIDYDVIKLALGEFSGTERRLEVKRDDDIMVISDYGHHPTEIKKTLKAVKRAWKRPVIAIFQPHRYTRTKDLLDRFAKCFGDSDTLILTEIYSASEKPIPGISGKILYDEIKKNHKDCHFIPDFYKIPEFVKRKVKKESCLLVLGAGDIINIVDDIVSL